MDLILRRLMDLEETVEKLQIRTKTLETLNGKLDPLVKHEIKDDVQEVQKHKNKKRNKIIIHENNDMDLDFDVTGIHTLDAHAEEKKRGKNLKPIRPPMRRLSIKLVRISTPPQSPLQSGVFVGENNIKSDAVTQPSPKISDTETSQESSSENTPWNCTAVATPSLTRGIQKTPKSNGTPGRTSQRKYPCQFCNKTYKYNHTMLRHLTEHTKEKPFSCTYCPMNFARKDHLSSHEKIHIGETLYFCKICPASFKQKGHLNRHNIIHTEDKPFACLFCSKSFTQKESLIVHSRAHTGEKPYLCDFCDKTFKSSSRRLVHMRTHK